MERPNSRSEGGSLFGELRLADVGQKARMRGAVFCVVGPGFLEAELAVDGEADFSSVFVFLTVVLPPADWAQLEGCRSVESLVSTTRTTEAHFYRSVHTKMDAKPTDGITRDKAHNSLDANEPPGISKAIIVA